MILPFSTQLNGKPTYFVEKIIAGLYDKNLLKFNEACDMIKAYTSVEKECLLFNKLHTPVHKGIPKLHTIREDKTDRWEKGKNIHFFINNRTKDMFQFAPVLPVRNVQDIFMTRKGNELEITIAKVDSYIGNGDKYLYYKDKELLAINDGFSTYDEFKEYFFFQIYENNKLTGNNWFTGKIIHWTDLKY